MRPKSFINSISVYQKSLHPTSFWIGVSYHKITIFVYQKDDGINSASRALELVKEAVVIFKNAQVEPGILARSLYKRAQLLTCIVNAGRDKVSLKNFSSAWRPVRLPRRDYQVFLQLRILIGLYSSITVERDRKPKRY